MTAAQLVAQVRDGGKGGNARCPAHEDNSPSLSVGRGRDGGVVVKCHAGCTTEAVVAAVDLDMLDLAPPGGEDWTPAGPAVATYAYVDENGETLYGVARTADKLFRQFRPDDTSKSGRRWSVKGVRKVPYRLPQILAAVAAGQTIYIVEGEKDVHAVEKAGESVEDDVPTRALWQGRQQWRYGMTFDEFQTKLAALDTLAGGLVVYDPNDDIIHLRAEPQQIVDHVLRRLSPPTAPSA